MGSDVRWSRNALSFFDICVNLVYSGENGLLATRARAPVYVATPLHTSADVASSRTLGFFALATLTAGALRIALPTAPIEVLTLVMPMANCIMLCRAVEIAATDRLSRTVAAQATVSAAPGGSSYGFKEPVPLKKVSAEKEPTRTPIIHRQ